MPIAIFDSETSSEGGPVLVPDEETASIHVRGIQISLGDRGIINDLPGPGGGKVLEFRNGRVLILHDTGDLTDDNES